MSAHSTSGTLLPLLLVLPLIFFISASNPSHIALAQTLSGQPNSLSSNATANGPVKLNGANPLKDITNLKTTDANITNLEFTTSYNHQYITWIEHKGRTNVIYVASSRDGGRSFDVPVNLSRTDGDVSNQHFVVNLEKMYGVYVEHETNNQDVIKFTSTNDGGEHWNTFTLVEPKKFVFELAIALQGNQVSVVWSDANNIKTVNHYIVSN